MVKPVTKTLLTQKIENEKNARNNSYLQCAIVITFFAITILKDTLGDVNPAMSAVLDVSQNGMLFCLMLSGAYGLILIRKEFEIHQEEKEKRQLERSVELTHIQGRIQRSDELNQQARVDQRQLTAS